MEDNKFDWSPYLTKYGKLSPSQLRWNPPCSIEYLELLKIYHWCETTQEVYFCDMNNIIEQPKCYCGNPRQFQKNGIVRYRKHCSMACNNKSQDTLSKRMSTNIRKRGVTCPFNDHKIKEKANNAMLERYGYINPMQSPTIRIKQQQTCMINYGCKHNKQRNQTEEQRNKLADIEFLRYQHHILEKSILLLSKELGIGQSGLGKIFNKFNIEVVRFAKSQAEKDLYAYIKSLIKHQVKSNDRKVLDPYELDIYIPKLKLAFEYDGTYWHGRPETKARDRWKTKQCHSLGITLYHIHESLWESDQDRIKQIVKNIINRKTNFLDTLTYIMLDFI